MRQLGAIQNHHHVVHDTIATISSRRFPAAKQSRSGALRSYEILQTFSAISRRSFFGAGLLIAAGPAAAQTKPVPPSSEVYKNLKVLGATPAESLNQGMHLISGELGVDCEILSAPMK